MTISLGYSVPTKKQIGVWNLQIYGSTAAKNDKPLLSSGDLICHPHNCAHPCLMSDHIGKIFKNNNNNNLELAQLINYLETFVLF